MLERAIIYLLINARVLGWKSEGENGRGNCKLKNKRKRTKVLNSDQGF